MYFLCRFLSIADLYGCFSLQVALYCVFEMALNVVRLFIPELKRNLKCKGQTEGLAHVLHILLVTLRLHIICWGKDDTRVCENCYATSSKCTDKLTRCFFVFLISRPVATTHQVLWEKEC